MASSTRIVPAPSTSEGSLASAGAERAPFVGRTVCRLPIQWFHLPFKRPWRLLVILSLLTVIGVGGTLIGLPLWAEYHYRLAQKALERYRLSEARAHLECCLRVWPSSFGVHLLAAQTTRRLEDLEAAEKHLARCQEIKGGLPPEVVLEE